MMTRRRAARHSARATLGGILLSAVLLGGLLTGCAPATGIRQSTTQSLQTSVLDVATSAASGDATAALTRLATLEASVEENTLAGNITPAERLKIRSAIALVRTDLEALVPVVTTSPSPSPAPSRTNPQKGNQKENDKDH